MKASATIIFFLLLALCHTSFSDGMHRSSLGDTNGNNEMELPPEFYYWKDMFIMKMLGFLGSWWN